MATQVQTINPTKTVTSNSESPSKLSNVMSVGGGFGDDAVDVTYSTKPNNKVVIPHDDKDLDGLNYLEGKDLSFVNEKAFLGTLEAHTKTGGVPNIVLEVEKLDAYTMGYVFYFFMKTCAMSAYLLDVNPFNQPGVEVYKKNMFHLLGKKGY